MMKKYLKQHLAALLTIIALVTFGRTAHAQITNIIIDGFDTTNEVSDPPWGEWFGNAFTVAWDSTMDASNNPNSGSLLVTSPFTGASQQIMIFDNFGGINPPIVSPDPNNFVVTNFQCDIRFDPSSPTNSLGNFGDLNFGSRGTGFAQPMFGNVPISGTNTNWVHVSLPVNINSQPAWASIPDVLIQVDTFSGGPMNGTTKFWVDNIKFVAGVVIPPPPTMSVVKATPGLRIFAGSTGTVFDREELASVDQNQSWIGGTAFPVSYSFKLLTYPNDANLGQTHIFLLPVNFSSPGPYAYNGTDFTSSNLLWLNIAPLGGGNVRAVVAWKTNAPNTNPGNVELTITNATAVGTWTLTFNNETNGTLTAPGASPASFTVHDPNIETDFGNPLVSYFGLQPNNAAGEGEFEDWGSVLVTNVAGVNESEDFTQETAQSANFMNFTAITGSIVLVTTNTPLWVRWTVPDNGFGLGTKANLNDTNTPWMTPGFFTGFGPDAPVSTQEGPSLKWTLIPTDGLPTVDGSQLGKPAPKGFFKLFNPPPAQ